MTPLDQLAVGSAPMALDVSEVELMVVQDRADRFVRYLDTVFPAIAGNIEVTCQRHVRVLAGAVQVKDQTNKLDLACVSGRPEDPMLPVVTEWDRAAVFTPVLFDGNGLGGSLRVELALEFRPNDRHAQEGTTVGSGRIDLLGDTNKVDIVLPKIFEE
ncbi:MAG TPA: hypothetical protein VK821_04510 [Dehalococcoidia bacterium]|nr:hypothetical protein [Dehalococcoidia bacterium]